MTGGSEAGEAGEASSSTVRVESLGAGQVVSLPTDRFAVEWWLARQTASGEGVIKLILSRGVEHGPTPTAWVTVARAADTVTVAPPLTVVPPCAVAVLCGGGLTTVVVVVVPPVTTTPPCALPTVGGGVGFAPVCHVPSTHTHWLPR